MTSTMEQAPAEKPKNRARERIETLAKKNRALMRENQTLARQLEESLALNAYLTGRLRSRGLAINALHIDPKGMH